jgi:ABC-2 type transport system ATP-binding protein
MAAISFVNVSKRYPSGWTRRRFVQAVDDVSCTIEDGQVVALLGPNRAGKTTLAKLALSLCRPTAGHVERLGRPSADTSTLARVGYVHENQAFPRYLSAVEILQYYGALALLAPDLVKKRADELLERVGLADRKREPISRFSKGMVQRLGLAQALLNDPELLVLDEPTEGLDLLGRQLIYELAQESRAKGRTVLLVSHVLPEVERLCDSALVIVKGRLAFSGRLADLKRGGQSLEHALGQLYVGQAA